MRNLLNGKINNNEFNMFVIARDAFINFISKRIQHDCYMILMCKWRFNAIELSGKYRNTIYV